LKRRTIIEKSLRDSLLHLKPDLRHAPNDSPRRNHWIEIQLCGTRSNRDGIGARIKVLAGDLTLIDEVHSGRGYQSHYGMYPHFGLGQRTRVDRIEVRWIGGGTDVLEGVEVDRPLQITEGSSRP